MNIGDKVKVAANGKTGVIISSYNFTPDNIAIVRLDDNETIKIRMEDLIKLDAQTEQDSEIPEGARPISKGEFEDAVDEVTKPENHPGGMDRKNPMVSLIGVLVGVIVGGKIAEKVFKDTEVITVTKDQLVGIIWDGCNPENMADLPGDNMTTSIAAIMTLRNIVKIFFPSGSEECK